MSQGAFVRTLPPPTLPRNAKASALLDRLLDALQLLDSQGSFPLVELAERVGLEASHLRDLLAAWMVAPADMPGSGAVPFTVVFGSRTGPIDDVDDDAFDAALDRADHVWLDSARTQQVSLLDDVGRTAITVDEVVTGLMAIRMLLARDAVGSGHRPELESLADRLSEALDAEVDPVSGQVEHELSTALVRRRRVELTYRDPWTGVTEDVLARVYDVYRLRDRRVFDAGTAGSDGFRTFEMSGVETVEAVGVDAAYDLPALPARSLRHGTVHVVLRVPAGSAARTRLLRSWSGVELGGEESADRPPGTTDVRVPVDRPAHERIGVLLAQLGPSASVVSPVELRGAGADVARRVLQAQLAAGPSDAPDPG